MDKTVEHFLGLTTGFEPERQPGYVSRDLDLPPDHFRKFESTGFAPQREDTLPLHGQISNSAFMGFDLS